MRMQYQLGHSLTLQRRDILDYPLHAHGEVELVLMCSGTCRAQCGTEEITLAAGEGIVVFPNQPHRYRDSRNVDAWLLIVPVKPWLSAYYRSLTGQEPDSPVVYPKEDLFDLLEKAHADLESASEPVIQGYLMVIFGKLLANLTLRAHAAGAEGGLRRILEYLNLHYREEVSRRELAKAVGYNESYVSHLFSQTMGVSIPAYIRSLRLEDACLQLRQTDRTIARIAEDLGFGSIRNFNRLFREHIGMIPSRYRASQSPSTNTASQHPRAL